MDPKLTFWCVSYYLSAFGTIWLPYETRCKTGRTRANVRATPLDHKLTFWCISYYYFGAFGTVWLPYETKCTTGRTSAKVRAMKSHRTFRNKHTRSTPLDPILTFWCVSYYLGAFGTVWLPYEFSAKRAELVQKFVKQSRIGIFRNERTRSTPLDPKLTFWCLSNYLVAFGTDGPN